MVSIGQIGEIAGAINAADVETFEKLVAEGASDLVRQVPVVDLFYILKSSIETNIHPLVFQHLVTGTARDAEREVQLLQLTLRNGNLPMAWMILNRWNSLEKLDLSNCLLTKIPSIPARHCQTLKELDLSGNRIEYLYLPPDNFPSLQKVNLENNPLTPYPEKCRTSWYHMKKFLQKLEKSTNGSFKKLIIVGDPCSGKTSLFHALVRQLKGSNLYSEIDFINTAQVTIQQEGQEEITLNIWDMGAEDNAIRNFFFTSRAIYILCFDVNSPKPIEQISFWLQLIQSLCRSTTEANYNYYEIITPTFLVATDNDSIVAPSKKLMQDITDFEMKILFRGNQGVFPVCCKTGAGVPTLIEEITKFIQKQSKDFNGISASWVLLDNYLHRLKRQKTNYIGWNAYETLCKQCGIKKSVMQSCTTFLRDAGTLLLYFNASSFWDDKSLIILDPQWLYNLLLCIFKENPLIKNGFISQGDVSNMLPGYSPFICDFAVFLLKKYSVLHIFLPDKYLIPSLLSDSFPARELERKYWLDVPEQQEHHRIIQFSFLPLEFFPRVIVRILRVKGIMGTLFWKNGVLLELVSLNSHQKCILRYNEAKYELSIFMKIVPTTSEAMVQKHGMLFRHVIEVVEVLLESYYPRLVRSAKRMIPCTHCLSRTTSSKPYMFSYSQCIDAVLDGKSYVYCNNIHSRSRKLSVVELAPDVSFVDLVNINEDELTFGQQIGEGSFGIVYSGIYRRKRVAIKALKRGADLNFENDRANFWEFQQESCIMSSLNHPNIVQLFGVTPNPPRLVMELLMGDLCSVMLHPLDPKDTTGTQRLTVSPELYSWKLRMRIAYDVALGMQYLQNISPPVIHRDLRSPNVFLASLDEDAPVCAKVADFGLARTITSGIAGNLPTWQWLAPEVILEDGGEYDISSDVYSFGIVLWELISFDVPFEEFKNNPRYSRRITDGTGETIAVLDTHAIRFGIIHEQLRPTIPKQCPDVIRDLLVRCWCQNPKKRPQFDEIVYILSLELNRKIEKKSRAIAYAKRSHSVNLLEEIATKSKKESDSSENNSLVALSRYIELKDRFVSCMECIPGSSEVWLGTSDGAIIVRDARDGSVVFTRTDAHTQRITSICFIGDTKSGPSGHVWTASADGSIQVWDIIYRQHITTLKHSEKQYPIKCLCTVTTEDNSVQVWSSSPRAKTLYCWDAKAYTLEKETKTVHAVHAMVQCGKNVWLGLEGGDIVVTDHFGNPIGTWVAANSTICSFLVYQNCVWSGSDDGTISMWYNNPDTNQIHFLTSHSTHFQTIHFIQKVYQHIWTASSDHSIIIWDAETLVPLEEIIPHNDPVVYILPVNSSTVWTSSTNGTIGIWSTESQANVHDGKQARSMSLQNERANSSDSLVKFTSVQPIYQEKLVHPSEFKNSYQIRLSPLASEKPDGITRKRNITKVAKIFNFSSP